MSGNLKRTGLRYAPSDADIQQGAKGFVGSADDLCRGFNATLVEFQVDKGDAEPGTGIGCPARAIGTAPGNFTGCAFDTLQALLYAMEAGMQGAIADHRL